MQVWAPGFCTSGLPLTLQDSHLMGMPSNEVGPHRNSSSGMDQNSGQLKVLEKQVSRSSSLDRRLNHSRSAKLQCKGFPPKLNAKVDGLIIPEVARDLSSLEREGQGGSFCNLFDVTSSRVILCKWEKVPLGMLSIILWSKLRVKQANHLLNSIPRNCF